MAASSEDETPFEDTSRGLDRAALDEYKPDGRHITASLQANDFLPHDIDEQTNASAADSHQSAQDSPSRLSKLSKRFSSKAKTRTKEILDPIHEHKAATDSPAAPVLAPSPPKSIEDDRLYHPLPEQEGMQAKDFLKSPVSSVQSAMQGASGAKFAEIMDNQAIAHGANVDLVRAYDNLQSAQNQEEKSDCLKTINDLKKQRQDSYVRWTMDRHVLRVRQSPPRMVERPRREDYCKDKEGTMSLQWEAYGQQLIRYYAERYCDMHIDESFQPPAATEEAINTSLERVVMTSMVYQTALMKVRHIYRWDDTNITAGFCSAYFLLVIVGHLGTGIMLFMLWLVIRRLNYPPTLEGLREDIKRSEDTEKTALNITQLIEQHGSRGWLEALGEKLGPKSMLQLEDLADALEIVRNFYEWRDPPRTRRALAVLAACTFIFAICPLWLLVRGVQVSIGVMFFGVFPITSLHPQYRHLVSPFKWAFWKITTDAQWAIARIQAEARPTMAAIRQSKDEHKDKKTSSNSSQNQDNEIEHPEFYVGKYHCTTTDEKGNLHHGHISVTSRNIKFETSVRAKRLWALQWKDVSTIAKARNGEGMHLKLGEDEEYSVDALSGKNELFTQIIGYSGLSWQVSD